MEYFIYFINTEHTGWEFLLQALCALLSFKRDLVVLIMSLELLFLTLSLEFLDVAEKLDDINGQLFVLFILAISACESAVALAMFLSLYQHKGTEMQTHIKYIKG